MKALNKRVINHICTTHAIEYGVNKAKLTPDKFEDGYCDVCEAKGIHDTPQAVTKVEHIDGLKKDDLDIAKPTADGVYEFTPSKEKKEKLEKELPVKDQKDGHNKKTPGIGPKPKKA